MQYLYIFGFDNSDHFLQVAGFIGDLSENGFVSIIVASFRVGVLGKLILDFKQFIVKCLQLDAVSIYLLLADSFVYRSNYSLNESE